MSERDGIDYEITMVGLSNHLEGYHTVLDGWCLHEWHANTEKLHVLESATQQLSADKDV
jgi:hypothetical protein